MKGFTMPPEYMTYNMNAKERAALKRKVVITITTYVAIKVAVYYGIHKLVKYASESN
jgi:hypothetical protein